MQPYSWVCDRTLGQESLGALQKLDPSIRRIVDSSSQVALYKFSSQSRQWEKTEVEGTLFVHSRLTPPHHGFTIMSRPNLQNLSEAITQDLELELQEPFLLYCTARTNAQSRHGPMNLGDQVVLHGIWFNNPLDCRRVADVIKRLTQQEHVPCQTKPRDPGDPGAAVDVIQMLTRAQTLYEKRQACAEPKEIRVSQDLHRNLIKPIPVKPSARDATSSGSKSISLDELFTSPDSPAASRECRPPVAALQKLDPWGAVGPPAQSPHRHHLHLPRQLQSIRDPSHDCERPHVLVPSKLLLCSDRSCPGSGPPHGILPRQQRTKGLDTSRNQDCVFSGSSAEAQGVSSEMVQATASPPTLLLSPSVFTRPQSRHHPTVLSRSQLQAALLHLIQTDSSFLDNIYRVYTCKSANSCSSK